MAAQVVAETREQRGIAVANHDTVATSKGTVEVFDAGIFTRGRGDEN